MEFTTDTDQTEYLRGLEQTIFSLQSSLSGYSLDRDRIKSLYNLALALGARFQHKGASDDLNESIALHRKVLELLPSSHPKRFFLFDHLASALFTRFMHTEASQDLDECIHYQREALALLPTPHPYRSVILNDLLHGLKTRSTLKGAIQLEYLEESIPLYREVLNLQPKSHPDRYLLLNSLAENLCHRFERKKDFEDLEECISLVQEEIRSLPTPNPYRPISLEILANALHTRFEYKNTIQDLGECVALHRESLDLRPAPHPERSASLNKLGSALISRFTHMGSFHDLEECIKAHQDALRLQPALLADRLTLTRLANALYTRARHKGMVQDLEDCISLLKRAAELQSKLPPDRWAILNNLGLALYARFEFMGDIQDLKESIDISREAINLRSTPHLDRPCVLNNLASALCALFEAEKDLKYVDECIVLYQEALELYASSLPNYSMLLSNLASALSARFGHSGSSRDLAESIELHHQALRLQPPPHPLRPISLNNLARAFELASFEHKNGSHDFSEGSFVYGFGNTTPTQFHPEGQPRKSPILDDYILTALRHFEEAARYETGSVLDRFSWTKNWAACAERHHPPSALNAYQYAVELLPVLASLDLTIQQRQDALQHGRGLVEKAAECAIGLNQYDMAIVFLTVGRAVFWSQALELRNPARLLATKDSNLAKKFVSISRQLEDASYIHHQSFLDLSEAATSNADITYKSVYSLADQRRQIIEEIRRMPQFRNFLLPPSFPSLQSAAENGPIVWLNASRLGCDALIMHEKRSVKHVPLSGIHMTELEALKVLLNTLVAAGNRSIDIPQDTLHNLRNVLGRDMCRECPGASDQITISMVLEYLWTGVVRPVVEALGVEKTEPLARIWWCPTGPFTTLPIHAAGIYSEDSEPIDCIFQYVVSSYCTSPRDLQHSPPPISQDFRMTVIIEPEAPNAAPLPATRDELKEIQKHVNHSPHLHTHVGLKGTPNQIDDVLSDIQRSLFVHFGCHGAQNLENPLESCLLLSGGKLTISKIMRGCQVPEGALAYLSACETAKGDQVRPDESLNLVATMMFAGFRSVVGTMWTILDQDAPVVADVFYGHLFRKGKDVSPDVRDAAYGLHLATAELRERGQPFRSWVPYVHYGI